MNREHIYDELSRLTALADGWRRAAEIPAIERDLMLSRLRELYGSLVFETAAAFAEPGFAAAAAAEEDETNEIIDIVLDDVFEEPAEQPAEESEFRDDSAATQPAANEEPEDSEEESLPEIEVEIVTDFESAFADDTDAESDSSQGEEPHAPRPAESEFANEPSESAAAAIETEERQAETEEAAAAGSGARTETEVVPVGGFEPEHEEVATFASHRTGESEDDAQAATEAGPATEYDEPAVEFEITEEVHNEPAEESAAVQFAAEPAGEPTNGSDIPTAAADDETEEEYAPRFVTEESPEPAEESAAVQFAADETDEPEFIVELEPAPTETIPTETASEEASPEETISAEKPEEEEDSEPEFIVEPAPAAVENPAAAEPGNGDTASQQNNLFGFDPVAAPRRSRHRMISLYDDDLFERIPVRKADKPAASDDDPQFEVVAPPAHEPTPQPEPEETDIIVEISPNDSEMPQAPKAGDSGRIAEFIVDDGPQTTSGAESFRSGAPAAPAEPAKVVLGDVLGSDRRTLGESMADSRATTADALAHTPVHNLSGALSIGDRYRIESELFGGDAGLCRRTLEKLDGMESLDDAVIYIEEHFSWHPSSEAACMIMELLERKFS